MISKNKILPMALVIVLSAIFFGVFTQKKSAPSTDHTTHQTILQKQKLYEQAKKYPGLPKAEITEQEKQSGCGAFLEAIETKSIEDLFADFNSGALAIDSKCVEIPESSRPFFGDLNEICKQRVDGKPTQECTSRLVLYKFIRLRKATENEDIRNLPTELLIQRFMGSLMDMDYLKNGLGPLRELAKEIYYRLPQSESAARAMAVGYIAEDHLSPELQQEFRKMIYEARERFPDSMDLFELDLVDKKNNDPNEAKKIIEAYYKQYPQSGLSHYHMGCQAWRENRFADAQKFFSEAVNLTPQHKRFTDTYEASLKTPPPKEVCQITINFNPQQF